MKKSIYIQPNVEVNNITVSSIICGSPDLHFGGGADPNDSETIPG